MIIKLNNPFKGQHCETTAAGTLLNHIGIKLSEPMLFGLGEGLGYIFWNMKIMDFPFIGGRIKPDLITKNLANNLGLILEVKETSSISKAWQNVKTEIDNGIPVGLKLDCYYLDYFTNKFHFAAHYAAMYGYDDTYAYLVDTVQQGKKTRAKLINLQAARNEKGPMSSKNMSYTIKSGSNKINLDNIILKAVKNNAHDYLNPPITNIGYKGILKTSKEIIKWFNKSKNIERDFVTTAMLMEKAGTGGALFRNLYRDFLKESYNILNINELNTAHKLFIDLADQWKEISSLFDKAGKTQNIKYINKASELLKTISEREKNAMEVLYNI